MPQLERFKSAQAASHAGFDAALREIRSGRKTGHWIWYVFPQIAGLGLSEMSQTFAIADGAEAVEFLTDPELRTRFLTITTEVARQLASGRALSLRVLMGSDVDARKIVSSMTLFRHAAGKVHDQAISDVVKQVLSAAASEGYQPCEHTLRALRSDA